MNKLTSTLAGLALVATASIAPAFAQGTSPGTFTFNNMGVPGATFSFTDTPAGFVNTVIPVIFNPTAPSLSTSTGTLTLTGGVEQFGATGTAGTFTGVTETFTPSAGQAQAGFTDTGGTVFVSQRTANTFDLASDPTTFTASGTSFDLAPGTPVVPEASTTISFGALLALGGLAVVLRRKGVKNAA